MRRSAMRGSAALLACAGALALLASSCAQSITAPTNRYAVLVGVTDYPGTANDLTYPGYDVTSMKDLLEISGWTVTATLLDANATNANISAAIAAMSTDPDATILVYYSGHGSTSGDTAYIIPYDGLTTGGYDLAKWITPATMTAWMGAATAKHRMLILDSCYSGGFTLGDGSVDSSPADYSAVNGTTAETPLLFAALSKFSTLVSTNLTAYGDQEVLALSAAGSNEHSYDASAYSHGAFTYYLLEAATYGDEDGDGYVSVSEAYRYAKARIKATWDVTYALSDGDFLPHISGDTGDLVLYIVP